jgi:hypothetical protein
MHNGQLHRLGNSTDFLATSWTSPGPAGPRMRPFDLSGDARLDAIEARVHALATLFILFAPKTARAVSHGSRGSALTCDACTRHLHPTHNSGLRESRNGGSDGPCGPATGVSISILECRAFSSSSQVNQCRAPLWAPAGLSLRHRSRSGRFASRKGRSGKSNGRGVCASGRRRSRHTLRRDFLAECLPIRNGAVAIQSISPTATESA